MNSIVFDIDPRHQFKKTYLSSDCVFEHTAYARHENTGTQEEQHYKNVDSSALRSEGIHRHLPLCVLKM